MPSGFDNDVMFAKNADFSLDPLGVSESNGLFANGELWIGRTVADANGAHVNVNTLTPGTGISIANGPGTITISSSLVPPPTQQIALQTGTTPISGSTITFNGAVVAAGTNPVRTDGTGASTMALEVQISQALAGADATKIGLSNFSSTDFAVAATGFVTLSTTGAGKTITGDTGGALSPTANNWNILGGPGVTTSGSGSTLTINSVVFTDTTAATLAVDNGYFATAAGTYNMPASAAQGELIHVVCDTAGAVVLDCPALNFIRIGTLITSSGGTVTSTAQGDSLTLRYRASSLTWMATSVIGTWVVA